MCIIVDTNTLAKVFDRTSKDHAEFEPVLEWIINGKGKVIFGGTRYLNEISKYLKLFLQLAAARKAVHCDKGRVDIEEAKAAAAIVHPDFDDQHLIGLLKVSGCKLICSCDQRAYPFFRHSLFFSPASRKPKIYRGRSNRNLLTEKNMADICKPVADTTNAQRKLLTFFQ